MNIHCTFDRDRLNRCEETDSEYTFGIWCELSGAVYPEPNWVDFGGVILEWWMQSYCNLVSNGADGEFLFMDGPYAIMLSRDRGPLVRITARGWEGRWTDNVKSLGEQLLQAARKAQEALAQMPKGTCAADNLKASIKTLEETLNTQS